MRQEKKARQKRAADRKTGAESIRGTLLASPGDKTVSRDDRVRCLFLPFVVTLFAAASVNAQPTDIELADLERITDADTMVMVPMRDGVRLATDIYRPKDADGRLPLIFIKTPYDLQRVRRFVFAVGLPSRRAGLRGGGAE